jgi:hypothetical protein
VSGEVVGHARLGEVVLEFLHEQIALQAGLEVLDGQALPGEPLARLLGAAEAAAGDQRSAGVVLRALEGRSRLFGLVKVQAVPDIPSRVAQMSPEELRAEARKLGIYPPDPRRPPQATRPAPTGRHPRPG